MKKDSENAKHIAALIGMVSLTDILSLYGSPVSAGQTSNRRETRCLITSRARDNARHHLNHRFAQLSKACLLSSLIACPFQCNVTHCSCLNQRTRRVQIIEKPRQMQAAEWLHSRLLVFLFCLPYAVIGCMIYTSLPSQNVY